MNKTKNLHASPPTRKGVPNRWHSRKDGKKVSASCKAGRHSQCAMLSCICKCGHPC